MQPSKELEQERFQQAGPLEMIYHREFILFFILFYFCFNFNILEPNGILNVKKSLDG